MYILSKEIELLSSGIKTRLFSHLRAILNCIQKRGGPVNLVAGTYFRCSKFARLSCNVCSNGSSRIQHHAPRLPSCWQCTKSSAPSYARCKTCISKLAVWQAVSTGSTAFSKTFCPSPALSLPPIGEGNIAWRKLAMLPCSSFKILEALK